MASSIEEKPSTGFSTGNPKWIENHKKALTHLEVAAKHNEFGDYKKASQNTFIAQVCLNLACDAQHEDIKFRTLNNPDFK